MQLFWHLFCENISLYFCKRNDVDCNFVHHRVILSSLNYTHDSRSTTLKAILLFHIDITSNDKGVMSQPKNQARIFDHRDYEKESHYNTTHKMLTSFLRLFMEKYIML